jgi:CRISPR-associated protein Cmr4
MDELGSLLFLYTETPLHAGSGVALGAVDLPIQRERMSGLPLVQGSGIKGALRQVFRERVKSIKDEMERSEAHDLYLTLFGREPPEQGGKEKDSDEDFASALSVQDARLLLLPVRTVWGGWAWVTSPMILQRLARDLEVAFGKTAAWSAALSEDARNLDENKAFIAPGSKVTNGGRLIIEDLDYAAEARPWLGELAGWLADNAFPTSETYKAFRERLAGQLALVSDAEMRFLSEHATEVVARIRIDPETGTVKQGALWSEESLPAETVLFSLAFFTQGRRPKSKGEKAPGFKEYKAPDLLRRFGEEMAKSWRIRLGGDRTVGRGIVGVRMTDAPSKGGR